MTKALEDGLLKEMMELAQKAHHKFPCLVEQIKANNDLVTRHRDELLKALPTVPHPGGRLVKVVGHYEDGSKQTVDGDVVLRAIASVEGKP